MATLKAVPSRLDQRLGDLSTTLDPNVRSGCLVTGWVVVVLGGAMVGRMASGRSKKYSVKNGDGASERERERERKSPLKARSPPKETVSSKIKTTNSVNAEPVNN